MGSKPLGNKCHRGREPSLIFHEHLCVGRFANLISSSTPGGSNPCHGVRRSELRKVAKRVRIQSKSAAEGDGVRGSDLEPASPAPDSLAV